MALWPHVEDVGWINDYKLIDSIKTGFYPNHPLNICKDDNLVLEEYFRLFKKWH
jgi:hypothetical protein